MRILIKQGPTGCGTCKRTFYSSKAKRERKEGRKERADASIDRCCEEWKGFGPDTGVFLPLCLGYIFVCQFDRIIQSFTHFVCVFLRSFAFSWQFSILSSSFSQSQSQSQSSLWLMFNCSGVLRLRNMRSQRTLHDLPLALALASINQKGNGIMHQHLHRSRSRSRTQPSTERVELSASLTSALTSSLLPPSPSSLLCRA